MKLFHYIYLSCFAALLGAMLCAYFQGWLVIMVPAPHLTAANDQQLPLNKKKKVTFYYWANHKWHAETQELLLPPPKAEQIFALVNSWLTLLDEEKIMDKKVSLQTALLAAADADVYLSFDRNPLPTECATFVAWMWIEGLLKTLRSNGIQVARVHFLVHHQPLQDDHLDFNNPWPITGFLPN